MRAFLLGLAAAIGLALTTATAFADDWTVTRLRGTVQQLVAGQWQPLERGSVIPDERTIFTRADGHAMLVRGSEAIELGPNTQIEIYDKGGRKPFTTILQHAGVLTVEAEVRNVEHFAVRTTYLAAVVKGTRFVVTARRSGGSVEVLRGQVSVTDEQNDGTVLIVAGQRAKVARDGGLTVSGKPKPGAKSPAAKANGKAKGENGNASSAAPDIPPGQARKGQDGGPKATGKPESTGNGKNKGKGAVDTVVHTVDTVVDKTTHSVVGVVDKTADTVDKVVDKTTDAVDKVTNTTVVSTTVDTVTDTLGKTTKGLAGLLGNKKK